MPSFGEKLKLEREKRKITLDEISASTKIGTRMLQALEEDKFNQLPGGIFNKGFVRAYARVVGLDEDQAVADYLQASGDAVPTRPELARDESAARDEEEHRISRLEAIVDSPSRPLPWGVFAVVLLAVALALSLWTRHRREQDRVAVHTAATKTALQSSEAPSPQDNSTSSTSGPATQPSPASAPANSTTPIPTAAASQKSAPASDRLPSDRLADQKPSNQNSLPSGGPAATPSPGDFTVVIQAREESWLSITADGKSTPSEILEPGTERSIRGHKMVIVRAGNVGGVDFLLNGKKLDVGGDYGEVKTVTIGPAGLVPVTASSPATPN